ncbi:MAG: hypothetical protein JNK14_10200 [Chitinophagaceae bacterium]|nr:hypothetical protein [Chitinophagaceae bacterium]
MAGKPIPVSTANEMIRTYLDYMTKQGVDMGKQTHSVSFTSAELMSWMKEVSPYADEFRICMGAYMQEPFDKITTIIWPYKDGHPSRKPLSQGKDGDDEPVDPFNDGNTHP